MDHKEIEEGIIERYWKAALELNREQRIIKQKLSNGIEYEASKLEALQALVDNLTKELIELPEKPATAAKKHNLVKQMSYIVQKLELSEDGLNISRNQGMALPNHIYGDIINDLRWAFRGRYSVVTIPIYHYSYDSDFDHLPVKELFSKLIVELNAKQFDDYPSLYNHFVYILQRINEIGAKEYLDNKKN